MLAVVLDVLDDLVDRVRDLHVAAGGQPPGGQQLVHLALGAHGRIGPGSEAVDGQAQGRQARLARLQKQAQDEDSCFHSCRILLELTLELLKLFPLLLALLSQSSCCGVSRICEPREAALGNPTSALFVEDGLTGILTRFLKSPKPLHLARSQLDLEVVQPREIRGGHEHLAPHLDQRRVPAAGEALWDPLDGQGVGGDVLAGAAVATGRSRDQRTVLVAEVDREPVDLQLEQVADVPAELGGGVLAPLAQLVGGEDVVQALHPLGVVDRRQPRGCGPAHGAGGRVLGGQLRVRLLERPQLLLELVVLGVGHRGRVVLGVVHARLLDLGGELCDALLRGLVGGAGSLLVRGHPHIVAHGCDIAQITVRPSTRRRAALGAPDRGWCPCALGRPG